jgi:hypothetical protein
MSTPCSDVFGAFLARIEEDDWLSDPDLEAVEADMLEILKMAVFDFRFPRIGLEVTGNEFDNNLTNQEIQVLATLMKLHWLRRQANTYRLIKQQYSTKDYELSSQANHLDKILKSLEMTEREAKKAQNTYDRVRGNVPFSYGNLIGGSNV